MPSPPGSPAAVVPLRRAVALVSLIASAACGSGNSVPNASSTSRGANPATSVRLSVDAQSEPPVQSCLSASQGNVARYNDNEAYVAADPRDADRLIAVWQTVSGRGSVIQWTRSTDGGKTWTPPRAAPINACAGGPVADAIRASDPWATFGPDGRAYISAIAWRPDTADGPDLVSALVVVASPDGGLTWDPPVAAAVAPSREIAHDNLAITADPTRPLTLYAATTRAESEANGRYFGRLGLTRSVDGGKTWSPIRPITAAVNSERIGAPQIVVDPRSGRLYAVYHRLRRGAGAVVGVMVSEDRGDTWSAEHVAARHVRGARARHPQTGREFVLATDIVQATVSPTTGLLIIAYADARRDPGTRDDVSIVWSAEGTRWSAPLAVSDSTAETAWLPAIASSTTGDVAVSYFSANFSSGTPGRARVMLQRFHVGTIGVVLVDRVVLDDASLEWPGDYQGLVAARAGFVATYGRANDIVATITGR